MNFMQRKLRAGVILSSAEESGGGFVQSANIARLLRPEPADLYSVEYVALDQRDADALGRAGVPVTLAFGTGKLRAAVESSIARSRALRAIARRTVEMLPRRSGSLDGLAKSRSYDLLVLTSPSRHARSIVKTPFIFTLWDLCHRDHPEFPEIAGDGSFKWREELFHYALSQSSAFIVDSEQLARRAAALYGVDEHRAVIVPYLPSQELLQQPLAPGAEAERLKTKYGLQRPFLFYPAQFWPHKNHAYILRAILLLKEAHNCAVDAVFSGSDKGNLENLKALANRMGIGDQIKFPGFVPTTEIALFYRHALALVMPTYFGPTNIPPLEARALGCRVIYSDEPGFREFCGDDTFYCNLSSPESLVDCVLKAMETPRPAATPPASEELGRANLRRTMNALASKLSSWRF